MDGKGPSCLLEKELGSLHPFYRLCQHRWIAFSGMVGFHNTVGSAALNNWVSPSSQQIAFGRGLFGSLLSLLFVLWFF